MLARPWLFDSGLTSTVYVIWSLAARAVGVQQHAYLHVGPGAVDQRVGDSPAQLPVLPQKGLEVHGVAGGTDARDEDVEEGPVLVYVDPVARDGGAQRQA